jgi:hypothetical protein
VQKVTEGKGKALASGTAAGKVAEEAGAGAGGRLRRRRLQLGMRQSALARRLGISAAYLNLIEHDKRRIGGRLLTAAAAALEVPVAQLAQGAGGALVEALRAAAAAEPEAGEVETAQAEAMAAAWPGWAALVAAQASRIAAQEQALATLSDRLTHDPFLSESVHDVLSSVTAIRSTAGILSDDAALDAAWRARFHRNLYEDSQRLAESAQALVGYLDAAGHADRGLATPQEEAEAWFAARGWHVAELERPGTTPEAVLAEAPPASAAGRALLAGLLRRYGEDAAALPLEAFLRAVAECGRDPMVLARRLDAAPMRVFRRFAALPEDAAGAAGPVGLVLCDASGTLTFRRPLAGFDFPRYGAACPLWPLYRALGRPMQPVAARIERVGPLPRGFEAYALSCPSHPRGSAGPEVVEAAMLLFEAEGAGAAEAVGTSCRICARPDCPARREPSVLGGAAPAG